MPILVSFLDGDGTRAAKIDRFPEACPLCHAPSTARFIAAVNRTGRFRQICFQCMNGDCRALFIATYEEASAAFRLVSCEPRRQPEHTLSAALSNISPGFSRLYQEALAAEAAGLSELSKLGLRVALEHLIRDFCTFNHPGEADAIAHTTLGECATRFVSDANLRAGIERAAHVLETSADEDNAPLIELLSLSVGLIEGVLIEK